MFYAFGYNKYNIYGSIRSIHAEIDAVNKLKPNFRKLKTVDVLIFRINKDGTSFLLGKPCDTCEYCLKHTIKGDANLVTVEEVKKLMGGDASGRVAR